MTAPASAPPSAPRRFDDPIMEAAEQENLALWTNPNENLEQLLARIVAGLEDQWDQMPESYRTPEFADRVERYVNERNAEISDEYKIQIQNRLTALRAVIERNRRQEPEPQPDVAPQEADAAAAQQAQEETEVQEHEQEETQETRHSTIWANNPITRTWDALIPGAKDWSPTAKNAVGVGGALLLAYLAYRGVKSMLWEKQGGGGGGVLGLWTKAQILAGTIATGVLVAGGIYAYTEAKKLYEEQIKPKLEKIEGMEEALAGMQESLAALRASLPEPEQLLLDSANTAFDSTTAALQNRPGTSPIPLTRFETRYRNAMLRIHLFDEDKKKNFLTVHGFFDEQGEPKTVEVTAHDETVYKISCAELPEFTIEAVPPEGEALRTPVTETAEALFATQLYSEERVDVDEQFVVSMLRTRPEIYELNIGSLIALAELADPADIKKHEIIKVYESDPSSEELTPEQKAILFLARVCKAQFQKREEYMRDVSEEELRAFTLEALFDRTGQMVRTLGRVRKNIHTDHDASNPTKVAQGLRDAFDLKETIDVEIRSARVRNALFKLNPNEEGAPHLEGKEDALVAVCQQLADERLSLYNASLLNNIRPPITPEAKNAIHHAIVALQEKFDSDPQLVVFIEMCAEQINSDLTDSIRTAMEKLTFADAIQLYLYLEESKQEEPFTIANASSLGLIQIKLKIIEMISRENPEAGKNLYQAFRIDS